MKMKKMFMSQQKTTILKTLACCFMALLVGFMALATTVMAVQCFSRTHAPDTPTSKVYVDSMLPAVFELNEDHLVVRKWGFGRDDEVFLSTTSGCNPLLDPSYSGNTAAMGGFNPRGMWQEMHDWCITNGHDGCRYVRGQTYRGTFDLKTGIAVIKHGDGATSWVGSDGLIAAALQYKGTTYVAYYA